MKQQSSSSHIIEKVALRACASPDVICQTVEHGRLRGLIFKPKGKGPFKGIYNILLNASRPPSYININLVN